MSVLISLTVYPTNEFKFIPRSRRSGEVTGESLKKYLLF